MSADQGIVRDFSCPKLSIDKSSVAPWAPGQVPDCFALFYVGPFVLFSPRSINETYVNSSGAV